jgi:predicted DNA-binding transcriptional regulator YafY
VLNLKICLNNSISMPQNKYPFARYRVIDRLLRSGKPVTSREMLEACLEEMGTTVTQRQIQMDIDSMMADPPFGFSAPIQKYKKAYFYSEEFSLDHFQLSKEELASLEVAASLIYQFRELGFLQHISTAIEKVKWGVSMTGKISPKDHLYSKVRPETVEGLAWQAHFPIVLEGLDGHQKLRLEYRKFEDEESTIRVVHPYLLKEYLNRWYLVGYCEKRHALRSFGLDRIQSVAVLDERFAADETGFDPEEYYKSTFGVTGSSGSPVEIILDFKPIAGKYILTVPLHSSQKELSSDNGRTRVSIFVYPTIEVYMKILSYGDEVHVVGPTAVVEEIGRRLKRAGEQY